VLEPRGFEPLHHFAVLQLTTMHPQIAPALHADAGPVLPIVESGMKALKACTASWGPYAKSDGNFGYHTLAPEKILDYYRRAVLEVFGFIDSTVAPICFNPR
jgi:hypothetical protein